MGRNSAPTLADLDGDGDLDALSSSANDSRIAWYENEGSGNFGVQQTITTSAGSVQDVYAADLDGDGDLDLLSASFFDNRVTWYENEACPTSPQVFVNANATGNNDGTSWENAFTSLQQAINTAESCNINEIWVATGTYKPADQTSPFSFPANVTLLGGFNGTETTAVERNPALNLTILSGDLNNDNTANPGDAHTIVLMINCLLYTSPSPRDA